MVSITHDIVSIYKACECKPPLAKQWIADKVTTDGVVCVPIDIRNHGFIQFVGSSFAMHDRIRSALNEKVRELMDKAMKPSSAEEEGNAAAQPAYTRKRMMIDEIPQILDVQVALESGEAKTVRVGSCWHDSGKLVMELTEDNMNLLLKDPAPTLADFVPELTHSNVKYKKSTKSATIYYCNQGKWKTKRAPLPKSCTSLQEMQGAFEKQSHILQEFYNAFHEGQSEASNTQHDGEEGG